MPSSVRKTRDGLHYSVIYNFSTAYQLSALILSSVHSIVTVDEAAEKNCLEPVNRQITGRCGR